jgi:hypothetical protein
MAPNPDAGLAMLGAGAMMLLWGVFALICLGLFLWALIDCVQREFKDPTTKIVWILVIIFVGFIGPILYLVVGRLTGRKGGAAPYTPPDQPPA